VILFAYLLVTSGLYLIRRSALQTVLYLVGYNLSLLFILAFVEKVSVFQLEMFDFSRVEKRDGCWWIHLKRAREYLDQSTRSFLMHFSL